MDPDYQSTLQMTNRHGVGQGKPLYILDAQRGRVLLSCTATAAELTCHTAGYRTLCNSKTSMMQLVTVPGGWQ